MDVESDYAYYRAEGLILNPIECGSSWSPAYFISFVFIVSLVILNLFIAVIFEAFDESAQQVYYIRMKI